MPKSFHSVLKGVAQQRAAYLGSPASVSEALGDLGGLLSFWNVNDLKNAKKKSAAEWDKLEGLRHSKKFLRAIGACFPNKINRLSRRQARYAIAAITGHFGTGSMLLKMGIIYDPTCRACNEEARKRLDLLGVAYPQPEDYCSSNLKASI
ncbi:jg20663 [Pararge aegeria aegeria]|uniref:Jg20663 protein n=1 Tax=Pararge aegeria aegeria TaxID=348720 RepID=A0A8S4R7A1_9NEOP|nr:jg20663 [Pararge aegeria aegeria]